MAYDELLLQHRILLVDREVDDEFANRIAARMLLLAESPADITMYINSGGGSVSAGMAVIDTMRFVPCDVATFAVGLAAGMAQCLLTAGSKGKRFAVPRARILMLAPSSNPSSNPSPEAIGNDDRLERTQQTIAGMLAEHSGQTAERISADWGPDTWFTAEEARAYGLIDRVADLPHRGTGQ